MLADAEPCHNGRADSSEVGKARREPVMLRTTYRGLGMALALPLVLACSPAAPAPSPAASFVPTAATTSGAAAAAGAAAPAAAAPARSDWDRLKEAAKGEGRVVVAGPGFPGLRNGLVQGFERAYG